MAKICALYGENLCITSGENLCTLYYRLQQQDSDSGNSDEQDEGLSINGYSDGIYIGSGTGFRGEVQVQVTVENGSITDVTVLSNRDDFQYFQRAEKNVINEILTQQSPDVDAVSGATFSSNGIMEAVANALGVEHTNAAASFTKGHGGRGKW